MKLTILFAIFLGVLALGLAMPSKGSTKASLRKKPCLKDCLDEYKPICAGDGDPKNKPKSFGSVCVLENYNCENSSEMKVVSTGECPGSQGVRLQ